MGFSYEEVDQELKAELLKKNSPGLESSGSWWVIDRERGIVAWFPSHWMLFMEEPYSTRMTIKFIHSKNDDSCHFKIRQGESIPPIISLPWDKEKPRIYRYEAIERYDLAEGVSLAEGIALVKEILTVVGGRANNNRHCPKFKVVFDF